MIGKRLNISEVSEVFPKKRKRYDIRKAEQMTMQRRHIILFSKPKKADFQDHT
jgi:hypothetical protein